MSLAHDMPYPADADVLLRYGVLRQCAEAHDSAIPLTGACRVLPSLCKPGVISNIRDDLPALVAQSVVSAQRHYPWFNQLIWELTSGTLLRGLEANTGLEHLLPDSAFHQGGWLQASPSTPVVTQHPEWNLSAALALDVSFSEIPAFVQFPTGDAVDVAAEGAVIWSLAEPASQPVWPVGIPVLRVVYYQGAGDDR